ncbi:MAG: excinuclease ABC subunit C [Bacteroidetes bacterium]|nr:excinuclease ABC subunit C [Bacteroidota bacterium]
MTKEEFDKIAPTIPHEPGCYKYYNSNNELIYVGKAKDLIKRVSSYFNKVHDSFKTQKLVSLIHRIEFTITNDEHDAFLLENSLIKNYQPRFNISLKDDKTYPFIVIKKEHFPRVFLTRRVIRDGSEYIGPFTGVFAVKELLNFVKQNIPLRTCNLNLSPLNIAKGKYKVCLEYHLGNCKGPCQGFQSEEDYSTNLQHVKNILKGKTRDVIKYLKEEMNTEASTLHFEKAAVLKKKIEDLQNYQSRSTVVNTRLGNVDVAAIMSDESNAYVSYMMVVDGSIIHTKTLKIEKKIDEEDKDILSLCVADFRDTFKSTSQEIITSIMIDVADENIKLTIPKVGDKKDLLELCEKNAVIAKYEAKKKAVLSVKEATAADTLKVLEDLQDALQLPELPSHIECFDNSNFQGAYPVAAMVCFKNGEPAKADYRHFHIKTVEGINDFASMSEVVYRRYFRLVKEKEPLPQLVIIDGGKGQLGAALESIEKLGLTGRMALVGLAKREEEIFFPGDTESIKLPYDSQAHMLVRRIRDEVHRFGITFHRDTRSKGTFKNELESIRGIGEQTATELLQEFRSIKNIKTLTERELTRVVGATKARIIWQYFNSAEE